MFTCSLLIDLATLSRSDPDVLAANPRPASRSTARLVDLLRSASASCASTAEVTISARPAADAAPNAAMPGMPPTTSDSSPKLRFAEAMPRCVSSTAEITIFVSFAIDGLHRGSLHNAQRGKCSRLLCGRNGAVAHDRRQCLVAHPRWPAGHSWRCPLRAHRHKQLHRAFVFRPDFKAWIGRRLEIIRKAEGCERFRIGAAAYVAQSQAPRDRDQFFCRLSVSSRV